MDTKKIKIILSAIKYKSFSKAADEIAYTPSAISHIADSLENEIGVKILERSPFGVYLSKEGEQLYQHLINVVGAEEKLLSAARLLAQLKDNHLRIGTFSSISQSVLPEIISEFCSAYPNIKISVSVEDNLGEWLEKDLVDIIFTDELSFGNNVWLPIMEDPFVVVVPSNMFIGRKKISKEELYEHTYISINEKILDSYFEKSRFANLLNFESVDNVSVLYMIQHNLGFSILPQLILNKKINGVKTLKLAEPISRTIGFSYKKGVNFSYATKTFIDFLTSKTASKTD